MGQITFTTSAGRAVELYARVDGNDPANSALILVVLAAAGLESDAILKAKDTLSDVLSGTTNEVANTGYCVDEETECLTKRQGWTRIEALQENDLILAYDPALHVTRWEAPSEIFVNHDYQGDMMRLSMRGFSALTTPDHRWPVIHNRGRWGRKWQEGCVLASAELPVGTPNWSLLRSAPHMGPWEPVYSDAFVRLAAWYFTEGSLVPGGKAVTIYQSLSHNPHHVESIRADIAAIGAMPIPARPEICQLSDCSEPAHTRGFCFSHYRSDYRRRRQEGTVVTVGSKRRVGLYCTERIRDRDSLVEWTLSGTEVDKLTACIVEKSKVPTMEFLTSLTPDQAELFVSTAIDGDGSPESRRFDQHHPARMDAYMAAAVLAGAGPTLSAAGTSCHLNEASPYISLVNVKRSSRTESSILIWCPVLPSGHWVARRNGKVHITGNSRKTLTDSSLSAYTVDDSLGQITLPFPTQTFSTILAGDLWRKLLVCYDGDTTSGTDANIIPITAHDLLIDGVAITPSGGDIVISGPTGFAVAR